MTFEERINSLTKTYPVPQAAALPALYAAEEEFGWISEEALKAVSNVLRIPPATLKGVATFYAMYQNRPMGRHLIQLCTNIACMIMGAERLIDYLKERYGLVPGGTTEDGRFSLIIMECIGACDRAPAMLVDKDFHADLIGEKIVEILDKYK